MQPLVNKSSKSHYLRFSLGIISLSRSRAILKMALSQTFCPLPSEFKIAGLDCNPKIMVPKILVDKIQPEIKSKIFLWEVDFETSNNLPKYLGRKLDQTSFSRIWLLRSFVVTNRWDKHIPFPTRKVFFGKCC